MTKRSALKSGDRFGRLIVICHVPQAEAFSTGYKHGYWMLKCDCGQYTKAPTASSLTRGIQTSCGWKCGLRERAPAKVKVPRAPAHRNLTGQRYGILTAIEIAPRPPAGQGAHWHCKCDCGAAKVVRAKDLRNGNTASCGCMRTSRKGENQHTRKPILDINRPWRKDEHVDDRWLVLLGQRSPVGVLHDTDNKSVSPQS